MTLRFRLWAGAVALLVSLPPAALAAGAATCPAFKSGNYVALSPNHPDPAWRVNPLSFKAGTLTFTDRAGPTRLSATDEPCLFTLPNGGTLAVAKSGAFLVREVDGAGAPSWSVGLPAQALTLAQVTGRWNVVQQETAGGTAYSGNGIARIDDKGYLRWAGCNDQGVGCGTLGKIGRFFVHADGGFTLKDLPTEGTGVHRFFGLKAADGSKLLVGVGTNLELLTVMSSAKTETLPVEGERYGYWEVFRGIQTVIGTMNASSITVSGVDEVAGRYQRLKAESCRLDSVVANVAGRQGASFRPAGNFVDCADGQNKGYADLVLLNQRAAFGFGAYASRSYMGLFVIKP